MSEIIESSSCRSALPCQTAWPQALLSLLVGTSSGKWTVMPWRVLWAGAGWPSRRKALCECHSSAVRLLGCFGEVLNPSQCGISWGHMHGWPWDPGLTTQHPHPGCSAALTRPLSARSKQVAPSGPGRVCLTGSWPAPTCLRLTLALPSESVLMALGFLSDHGGHTHQASNLSPPSSEL